MIRDANAPWTLHIDREAHRPLVRIAYHSLLHICIRPLTEIGVPSLTGPSGNGGTRTITGYVQVRSFLESRMPAHPHILR